MIKYVVCEKHSIHIICEFGTELYMSMGISIHNIHFINYVNLSSRGANPNPDFLLPVSPLIFFYQPLCRAFISEYRGYAGDCKTPFVCLYVPLFIVLMAF